MSNSVTLYIYNNTYTLSTSTKLNNSMPLYDKNILLYCGVDNKSNFKIVTDNNVPKNLTGLTPYFNITDIESEETVLSRPMTVTNASRGEAEIDITQADLYSIAEGFYNFTVYTLDSSQVKSVVYTDRSGDIQGTVEVKNSGLPKTRATQTADSFTLRNRLPLTVLDIFLPIFICCSSDIAKLSASVFKVSGIAGSDNFLPKSESSMF